jgi:hypothetical protein
MKPRMKWSLPAVRRTAAQAGVVLACLLGVASVGQPAQAQTTPDDIMRARQLFQRAIELEQAQDWGKALDIFRAVGAIKLTPQVRFHIATCEENLGKLLSALGGYKLAFAEGDTVGEQFKSEVQAKITALEAVIPKLTIKRGKGAEDATILLDGIELGAKSIGVEMPADPGPHAVIARSAGKKDFKQSVSMAEKDHKSVLIEMQDVEGAGTGAGAGKAVGGEPGPAKKRDFTVPIIIGAAGGASLIASGVFYYLRTDALSKTDKLCNGNYVRCTVDSQTASDQVHADHNNAVTYNAVSIVTASVGVVALGVAATLILTGKSEPAPTADKAARFIVPELSPTHAGLSFGGRF